MNLLEIFVPGEKPRPKGSMRHIGRGRMIEDNKHSKPWRTVVTAACTAGLEGAAPYVGDVEVELTFIFPRPKSRPHGGPFSGSTADLDKLMRNVSDSLQDAGVIKNDSMITRAVIEKVYAEPGHETGVAIKVIARYPNLIHKIPRQRGAAQSLKGVRA